MKREQTPCIVTLPCMANVDSFSEEERRTGCGAAYTPYEHPDLLRALRGLMDYHRWVEARLIPIASKWMDEHREEILANTTEEAQSDVGASVEAAFKILKDTDWWRNFRRRAEGFNRQQAYEQGQANPVWVRMSKEFFQQENSVKQAFFGEYDI
jgi:hypothetical protein